MASKDNSATTTINALSGRQNQPSQIADGTAPSKMPFS